MPIRLSGRWTKFALAVSLALNLAVIGVVAGVWLHRGDVAKAVPPDAGRGLFGMVAVLPPDRRAALRDELGSPPDRAAMAAQWAAFRTALQQPEVSAADLQAMLARIRTDQGEMASRLEAALAAQLSRMSLEDRVAYVERLERFRPGNRHPGGPRDGRHGGPDGPPPGGPPRPDDPDGLGGPGGPGGPGGEPDRPVPPR